MVGQLVPVQERDGELIFALAGGAGGFRGSPQDDGSIRGMWTPSPQMAMGGHGTPVTLAPWGSDRWRGEVAPFDDVFTFYLLLRRRPDGSLGALLRNPERDWGALIGPERLEVEGSEVRLIGTPRWATESEVLATGSYDAESGILTLAFPPRGGSYDFRREGDDSEFYPRGLHPDRYAYRPPPRRDDGWETGTLEEVGIDRAAIERAVQELLDMPMDSVDAPQFHGLLIARHGKLVLEEYFHGEYRDHLHETRSAAKSVTATLIGAALHAGEPIALSDPVYRVMNGGVFPVGLEPRKRAMTLENLLTMSSGYFCDDNDPEAPGNENGMQEQTEEPDWLAFTLRVPMAYTPGDTAIYCSANPNLALGMLAAATGESPIELFQRLLGDPMQIEHFGWGTDPAGHPYGGGGVQFLPRDFMKFGQLMLDEGTWDGRRLLDAEFARRAASPLYGIGSRRYGYLWWVEAFDSGGRSFEAFSALGAGGQRVTVVPELDLVIASYGANYASRGYRYMGDVFMPEFLLPAVR